MDRKLFDFAAVRADGVAQDEGDTAFDVDRGLEEAIGAADGFSIPIAVHQMRRRDARQRVEDRLEPPGCLRSHSRSIALTCLRCRFSCEPHRLHGMIGNCIASA